MRCARVDEVLCESPTADALAHAKTCADCGPARAAWDAMGGAPASGGSSLEKAREAARAELKAVPKARNWWVDGLMLIAINFGIVGLGALVLKTPMPNPESPMSRWGIETTLLCLMGLGTLAAVRPGARPLRFAMLAIAAIGAIWVCLGGSGLSAEGSGIACAVTESVVCIVPLLVALWITSRFAYDLTRALVGGLSVGATGMLVLHFHCLNGTVEHLVMFHVLPWGAVAVAAVAVRRMLPSRSYAP